MAMACRRGVRWPLLGGASLVGCVRALSSSGASPAAGLSVRQRLKQQSVPEDVLQRIHELGVSREKGKQANERRDIVLKQMSKKRLGKMKLICSANAIEELPTGSPHSELALAGRSNVGKSSLLNALVGRRGGTHTNGLAEVENKPGVTKSLNFYENPAAAAANLPGVRLVDMPGYGFAYADPTAVKRWQNLMHDYVVLDRAGTPQHVMLVLDARQSLRQADREFLLFVDSEGRAPVHVVLTKCDLVLSAELAKRYVLMERELAQLGLRRLQWPLHMASARTGGGIAELRSALDASLPGGWLRGGTPAAADAAPAHPGAVATLAKMRASPGEVAVAGALAKSKGRSSGILAKSAAATDLAGAAQKAPFAKMDALDKTNQGKATTADALARSAAAIRGRELLPTRGVRRALAKRHDAQRLASGAFIMRAKRREKDVLNKSRPGGKGRPHRSKW